MCTGYCNICGCRMKAIPSFCYAHQCLLRCNLISTWTGSENLPESHRAVVILASSNFSNKIIFPKNGYTEYSNKPLCVVVPYCKPHWQSAFKHQHSFNQAAKHCEHPGHHSWYCSALFHPPGGEAGLESPLQLPQVCSLCAWLHFPVTAKNKLQGDSANLLSPGPLLPEGEVFVFMKKMFMKSTHQSCLSSRTVWVIKQEVIR